MKATFRAMKQSGADPEYRRRVEDVLERARQELEAL
jgi:hypothetical protein